MTYVFPYDKLVDPVVYAKHLLGLRLYEWQKDVLRAVARREQVALRAANGSGKTSMVAAPLVLWFLHNFRDAKAVATSGSWAQVRLQLMDAIRRHQRLFQKWKFNDSEIYADNGSVFYGFSTNDPGRAEGHHAKDPQWSPLLYIVDEAKSVADDIFAAVDRCGPQYRLYMSSTGAPSGKFYRCFTKERAEHTCFTVTSYDCPHIPEEKREQDKRLYGEDSSVYRSIHLAAFTEDTGESVFSLSKLEDLYARPPDFVDDRTVHGFCDFAAGGDENVFALRRGNKVTIVDAWREKDTMRAVARFITKFVEQKLRPEQISGDASGLGTPMIDAMSAAGWPVNRFHFGGRAQDEHYVNCAAEVWYSGARMVERKEVILPDDERLRQQLLDRGRTYNTRGKLAVEDKEAMRARGADSPDRADAVLGAMRPAPQVLPIVYDSYYAQTHDNEFLRGANPGGW